MPRYMVERVFREGFAIPVSAEGAAICQETTRAGLTYAQVHPRNALR